MKRLNIYFIHSKKFDYENLIYKKVLSSSVCLNQNIILPYSKNNQTTYTKDLMEKADFDTTVSLLSSISSIGV